MIDKIKHYQKLSNESKNIFFEREKIKGTLKEALPAFEQEKEKKQEAIIFALSHRTLDQITQEQRIAKVAMTANFRETHQELITRLKKLATQSECIGNTKNAYNQEIHEIYFLLQLGGLTHISEQQFKRTLFIEPEEFRVLFEKDALLQSLADISGFQSEYVHIIWDDYYHKGASCGENFGINLNIVNQLIELIIEGLNIDNFNDSGFDDIISNMDKHQRKFLEDVLLSHYHPEYDWLKDLLLQEDVSIITEST